MASNGKGRDAIMDIQDYERIMATIKLMEALESGRKSGEEQGWISSEQLKSELQIKKWFIKTTLQSIVKMLKYNQDKAPAGGSKKLVTIKLVY